MPQPPRSIARVAVAPTHVEPVSLQAAANTATGSGSVEPAAPMSTVIGRDVLADAPPSRRLPWPAYVPLCLAAALLLKAAEPFAVPVLYAVTLALVLASPVQRLAARGIRPATGALVVVAGLLLTVGLIGFAVVKPASDWWHRAPATVERMVATVDRLRAEVLAPFGRDTRGSAPGDTSTGTSGASSPTSPVSAPAGTAITEKVASEGYSLTRNLVGGTLTFAFSSIATVILLYFLLASQDVLLSHVVQRVAPGRRRALVLGGLRQMQREIGLFLGTMCFMNAALGVATGIGLALIGLPNAVLWGTVTAVLTCIPYLGPLMVAVALLFAGGIDAWGLPGMFGPTALFLGLHGIEAWLISPIFMGHRLRLAPAAVIVAVMLWGWIWGVAGALLAVPLLLALRIVCRRTPRWRIVCVFLDGRGNAPLPTLRSLLAPPTSG